MTAEQSALDLWREKLIFLRKHELRFAKVADPYRNALRWTEPAALTLLERDCLSTPELFEGATYE